VPSKGLKLAPGRVLEETIEPLIRVELHDPDIKIFNTHSIDFRFGDENNEWKTVFKVKRLRAIVFVLLRLEPSLTRSLKNDGKTFGHLLYRKKD
jgi:hypothetical protein